MRQGALVVAALACAWLSAPDTTAQQPVFRTGTDPVLVDVQVVTRDGTPVTDLTASDFIVEISGRRRPVANVEFIDYRTQATSAAGLPATTPTEPSRTASAVGASPQPRRTYVIAVDESSFQPGSVMAYRQGILRFIDQLEPTDLALERDAKVATARGVEQAAQQRRRIKSRGAQPDDGPIARDECRGGPIPHQPVIFERQVAVDAAERGPRRDQIPLSNAPMPDDGRGGSRLKRPTAFSKSINARSLGGHFSSSTNPRYDSMVASGQSVP